MGPCLRLGERHSETLARLLLTSPTFITCSSLWVTSCSSGIYVLCLVRVWHSQPLCFIHAGLFTWDLLLFRPC